jgi:dynein intermediate chain 1
VGEDEQLFNLAGGTCFDFHNSIDHLFVVGTEEGEIHKCSKSYSNQYLLSYEVCVNLASAAKYLFES